jgi:hypothetical protein
MSSQFIGNERCESGYYINISHISLGEGHCSNRIGLYRIKILGPDGWQGVEQISQQKGAGLGVKTACDGLF